MHALDLDLSIDGAAPQHFFSDFVPVTQNDGTMNIPISINGVFCRDTVIRVSASPVRQQEIQRYRFVRGSTYQQGCFEPCDCPLEQQRPLAGRFVLVPLLNYGTYVEYSVVQVRMRTGPATNAGAAVAISGFGSYKLIQGFAGPMQIMDLWLSLNGAAPNHFDNSDSNARAMFPAIEVVVDMNNQVCYDVVLSIKANPVPKPASNLSRQP
jgi:hypothetical protein